MTLLKKSLFTFLLFSTIFSFAQEEILTFENSLKTSTSSIKSVIPIVNEKNGDLSIFIADAKNIYGYKFNNEFDLVENLLSPEKRRQYKVLIGSSTLDNGNHRIFLTNNDYDEFSSIELSFDNKENSFKEFKLFNPHERFIQTTTYNNKFYLISAAKLFNKIGIKNENTSQNEGFYIYSFDDDGNPKRNEIDLSEINLVDKRGYTTSLPGLILYNFHEMEKIENNIPNSIETASKNKKMYSNGNKIIFTFDVNKKYTQALQINLETFEASLKSFIKPKNDFEEDFKKTNSYINGDKIFTIASTKKLFKLQIHDYERETLLKEFSFSNDDAITFKNTPIIQEGGMYEGYRELENSKKFLRKITAYKIGISAIKVNNLYHLTIGGYSIKAMPMGGFYDIPVASLGNFSIFFNPAMFAYNSKQHTKSTRIECLFDHNFNHVKGEVKETAFDKIKKFEDNYTENKTSSREDNNMIDYTGFEDENDTTDNTNNFVESARTIFKYKDYYILGIYNAGTKKYTLIKFKD